MRDLCLCMLNIAGQFFFRNFSNTDLYHSDPRSISNLSGDRLDVFKMFESSCVIGLLFLFLSGTSHKYLLKLSIFMKMYLYP